MRVCLVPRLLIVSGLMCCNMDLYDWLNNFCNFYMAAVVDIVNRHGFTFETCHRNQPNKTKLVLFVPLHSP